MEALATPGHWDWRRQRAWGGLEALLRAHPEGVAAIAATDRLLEYGLRTHEALELIEELRAAGTIGLAHGRWVLR